MFSCAHPRAVKSKPDMYSWDHATRVDDVSQLRVDPWLLNCSPKQSRREPKCLHWSNALPRLAMYKSKRWLPQAICVAWGRHGSSSPKDLCCFARDLSSCGRLSLEPGVRPEAVSTVPLHKSCDSNSAVKEFVDAGIEGRTKVASLHWARMSHLLQGSTMSSSCEEPRQSSKRKLEYTRAGLVKPLNQKQTKTKNSQTTMNILNVKVADAG